MVRSNLDSVRFVIDVEHALLDLLVDLLGRVDERLLYISSSPCGRLHEHQVVLSRKRLTLLLLHFTSRVQVTGREEVSTMEIVIRTADSPLVANQHDYHVRVGMLASVLQPGRQVVECLPASDVVDEQSTSSTTVVRPGDGPKRFLASRVPDLQFNLQGRRRERGYC